MRKFKIFYSWQSDLPGNKTRNFIRDCIDEAIDLAEESEAIEAERDEATKDTTGSPNIVTTLFSKIDDCDLFIADVSLCFTSNTPEEKKSPNPNVLLELGYAVKTLSWERVICLCNTDFGKEYPFDIAHNRITNFSLEGKSKKEVMSDISKIIFFNIRALRKAKPRTKIGEAHHVLGSYDFSTRMINEELGIIDIAQQEGYLLHNKLLLEKAKKLLDDIQELNSKICIVPTTEEAVCYNHKEGDSLAIQIIRQDALSKMRKNVTTPAKWREVLEDSQLIKKWLDISVPEDFFNLGNLKYMSQGNLLTDVPILLGTDEEKEKQNKLRELSGILNLLEFRAGYLKTFDGMVFVPIAIKNISTVQDENIHIVLNIENGELINPTENLICKDYEGIQGRICRDDEDENDVGIICELFSLREDGLIHTEDIPYNQAYHAHRTPILTANGYGYPPKNEKDYAFELQEFIASSSGQSYYEFDISALRPGECKWLSYGMLIRPNTDNIKVKYQIHSTHSIGDLSGTFDISVI